MVYGTMANILPKWASKTLTSCPLGIFQTYRFFLTPATANSSCLLRIMLLDCKSLTDMFLTPVGSFKSILFPLCPLASKSAAAQTQNPKAVVPKMWFSVSLKLNWRRASSPSKTLPFIQSNGTGSLGPLG